MSKENPLTMAYPMRLVITIFLGRKFIYAPFGGKSPCGFIAKIRAIKMYISIDDKAGAAVSATRSKHQHQLGIRTTAVASYQAQLFHSSWFSSSGEKI